ncbi:Ig-like domain-containing protein [Tessaracoccus sp. OH4464_COT-324]|uniref:Ig-like domain-containing protein n=1 Tax=Tessaracoccus sp. OH4464_COT-324 TaxID=2491059 RepID=UPI000F63F024|nr:Ig-like domain-containing protein [Tessaracoccus sp. OH4464_COT-324]RRD46040.1 fibronectin type III domain-containing protein [Tessaracoccus sp. OH4464_COT-324]
MTTKLRARIEKGVAAAVALGIVVVGVLHEGVPAAELDLHDGGVWIMNQSKLLAGHINFESSTQDAGIRVDAKDLDISQSGDNVVLVSPDSAQPVDVSSFSILGKAVTAGMELEHGGDVVLVADSAKGKVWLTNTIGAGSFNPSSEPTAEGLNHPRVAVGPSGAAFVLTKEGQVFSAKGIGPEATLSELDYRLAPETSKDAQLAVAGRQLVVLDGSRLFVGSTEVEDPRFSEGVLQQSAVSDEAVLVATANELLKVSPVSGAVESLDALRGEPVQPVWLDGCAYGLWRKSGYFLRDCGPHGSELARQFPELVSAKSPVFRTNRHVILINDVFDGSAFVADESMLRVDNWDLIAAQLEEQEKEENEESEQTDQSQIQEAGDTQNPPVARDDEFGARVGTSVTLPVILNDLDADGDVLTVRLKDVPEGLPVSLAKDGRAVTVQLSPEQRSPIMFSYQAFDGVEASNVASVRVSPRTSEQNEPPVQQRKNTLYISERTGTEYAVLNDWFDPDGDPIYLERIAGEEGLATNWRADGFASVKDLGTAGPGRKALSAVVSDGRTSTAGELVVQIAPGASNSSPVAGNDHYVTRVGENMTLNPLSNDTDPDDDELRLVDSKGIPSGVELSPNHEKGTFEFRADQTGSYVFTYGISDGPHTAVGKIRVDVIDPADVDERPVAQNDLALLSPDSSVMVEPLRNDQDPAGGILALASHTASTDLGITVELLEHSLLRISSLNRLEKPVPFTYTVSNGKAAATASILVVPQPPLTDTTPPVANPEATVVRAGDIVGVDVLANDFSPSGLELKLLPEVTPRGEEALGEFFVYGDKLRFRAGRKSGTAVATYTAQDTEGNVSSAEVTVVINEFEAANQKPLPKKLEARTYADSSATVEVPIDGVDPDGDSVTLVGVGERQPQLGNARVEGNNLIYEPNPRMAGTDTFDYVVRDRFGMEGVSTIRIGVIPPPATNLAPVAVADETAARPSVRLEIPVLANDLDPDGDVSALRIVAGSVRAVDPQRWNPETQVRDGFVVVTTPAEEGIYQLYYDVTDGGGSPVTGVISVEVGAEAPPIPPVAKDDVVSSNEVIGREFAEVELLKNDYDLDGERSALKVTLEGAAEFTNGVARVPLTDDRQVLIYTLTDVDGLEARAAIIVPGRDQLPPQLNPDKLPARVKGGETLIISLDEYVLTRPNHRSMITSEAFVAAGPGGNKSDEEFLGLRVVDERTITFTPDKHFIGATSVSFEVTDGGSLEDPRGLKARLSLPIDVQSSGLFPPELRPSEIQVAPGESAVLAQLGAMVNDPDPGDNERMAFSLVSAEDPVSAKVSGKQMSVSVPTNAQVGQLHNVVVQVHDGSTDPQQMTVPVRVIVSPRPLMQITELHEKEGRAGRPTTFDLSQAITNPFAAEGGQIKVVGQPQVQGGASVHVDGLRLTVTPNARGGDTDSAENVAVTYTVQDATEDKTRERTGILRLTVKDVPKAPVNVAAEVLGSRTAKVTWSFSGWRGGTPKGFTVHWSGGSKDCGMVTSCVIDTLANNNNYQFTVRAQVQEADIGSSPESSQSNSVFVDVIPNTPGAPTAAFGDGRIKLNWAPVAVPDGGSPVQFYKVYITPRDQIGRTEVQVTGTSFEWDQLSNGTAYTFKVSAHNKLTESDKLAKAPVGPPSTPEIPAGPPKDQGPPTVKKAPVSGNAPLTAELSWAAPGNPNGDSSFLYEVKESGTENLVCQGVSSRRCAIKLSASTEDRTYQIRSTNKSGSWSDWSSSSNAIRAFTPPGPPKSFSVEATGASNTVRFQFAPADGNGARPSEIYYEWSAGGATGRVAVGDEVSNSVFVNGRDIAVTLRAVSVVNGETARGTEARASVNAYGPPAAPDVSAQSHVDNGAKAVLRWNSPASSNGRPIERVEVTTTQGGTRSESLTGGVREGTGPHQTLCISAVAVNDKGQRSASSHQACGETRGRGSARQRHGAPYGGCPWGNGEQCDRLQLWVGGWYPNASLVCTVNGIAAVDYHFELRVNPSGDWGWGNWGTAVIGRGFMTNELDVSGSCRYK